MGSWRLVAASALLLWLPACVTSSIACGVGMPVEVSRAPEQLGEWLLVRVEADGAVILSRPDEVRRLPPPGSPRRPGQIEVLASDAAGQTASIRFPGWQRTTRFLAWEWRSDAE